MTHQTKKTNSSKAFGQRRTDRWSASTLPVAPWLLVLVYTFLMVWLFQLYMVNGIRPRILSAIWLVPGAVGLSLYEELTILNCLFLILLVGHSLLSPFVKDRRPRWGKFATLALALLSLTAAQQFANGWKGYSERFVEETAAMRLETERLIPLIEAECAKLGDHPWAGEYFEYGGPTESTTRLWIGPESGYVTISKGEALQGIDRAEFLTSYEVGEIELEGTAILLLRPQWEGGELYVPVTWGDRHYLIPVESISTFKEIARESDALRHWEPLLHRWLVFERVSDGGTTRGEPKFPPGY